MKINNPVEKYKESDNYKIRNHAKLLISNGICNNITEATILASNWFIKNHEELGPALQLLYDADPSLFLNYK